MITREEYTSRRNKLFNMLDDNSVTILFSGVGRKKSGDENYDFVPNKNFYYLTGIEQENSVLMLIRNDGEKLAYLFVDEKCCNTGFCFTVDNGIIDGSCTPVIRQ